MSNWEIIQRAIEARGKTLRKTGSKYRCASPLRANSDNKTTFVIEPDTTGDNGVWYDHNEKRGGNFYQLADILLVELEQSGLHHVPTSKREYTTLVDYAQAHGIKPDNLIKAGWREERHNNRPALIYATDTGDRVRYLDSKEPRHMSPKGYKACWYHLKTAVKIGHLRKRKYLVIVNGNASAVAGMQRGIPTTCLTDGEKAIPEHLLKELKDAWTEKIIIALDCDEAGERAAMAIKGQLGEQGLPVMMPLSKNGDFADFCKLFEDTAYDEIVRLATGQNDVTDVEDVNLHTTNYYQSSQVRKRLFEQWRGNAPLDGRVILSPVKSLRKFGGFGKYWRTRKITVVIGKSGDGKTMYLETMNDQANEDGHYTAWWGGEWSDSEMEQRRIQRYINSVDFDVMSEHELFLHALNDGKDPYQFHAMPDSRIDAIESAMERKFAGYGETEYIPNCDSVEEIVRDIEVVIERLKNQGKRLDIVFIDYVQLMDAHPELNNQNHHEYAFSVIKQFAIRNDVHVVMSSQVTKTSADNQKNGVSLTTQSAQYIRSDKANQILILDRQYRKVNGTLIETPCYWVNIGKLSIQKANMAVKRYPILMQPERLFFAEYDWTTDPQYDYLEDNQENRDYQPEPSF